jgi:hypothetical protein
MLMFMRGFACYLLALLLAVVVLAGLMFSQQTDVLKQLLWSGQLLSELALYVLPAGFWEALTGVSGAGENPAVQSFLQLCVALGQLALLPALGLYRLWYRS